MSRNIRYTQSNRRFTETFDRPTRGPLWLAVALVVVGGTLIACDLTDDDRPPTVAAVVTQPDDSTPPPIVDSSSMPSAIPQNVTFASAESTFNARRYADAADMFGVYVQMRPQNPWGHYMLGLSAWKAGRLDEAVGAFERSLELDSTHVKSYLNLGRVLLEQNRPKDALVHVGRAADLDPESAEVHRMLGRVHASLGDGEASIAAYRVALTLDGSDVWSMNNMALVLIREERYDEALPALARAVELRPGSPVFQNNLGIALENTGRFTAAAVAYRAAVAADATYTKASNSLARVTGISDDPAAEPVDLVALARGFETQLAAWKSERTQSVGTSAVVKPDSVKVPER